LIKYYGVKSWEDTEDFLKQLAIKKGKLKKGGEPDILTTAKLVLIDWQRGELPYFTLPND
jgi:nuclear GTP-binding protein